MKFGGWRGHEGAISFGKPNSLRSDSRFPAEINPSHPGLPNFWVSPPFLGLDQLVFFAFVVSLNSWVHYPPPEWGEHGQDDHCGVAGW